MNRDRLFDNKNVDSQVLILNDIILNIFRNFVPDKYVTCDDKDPVWMNENIKSKIEAKISFIKNTLRRAGKKLIFVLLKSPYVI